VDWLLAAVESGDLEGGKLDFSGMVFHDACHTPRLNGSWLVTRKLFSVLGAPAPGELFWRERTASPCGAVGGFEFTQPELAKALAEGRLAEARKAGARVILTDDPQCAAHLAQYSDGIAVRSLPEIIWEQLAGS